MLIYNNNNNNIHNYLNKNKKKIKVNNNNNNNFKKLTKKNIKILKQLGLKLTKND
jgi:hypothetical protein